MGELRSAAVLFADIAASTDLRQEVGDLQADAILDPLIGRLTEAVRRNHGDVIKSDGDDVVAVFDRAKLCVDDAAQAAIDCQIAAREAGRRLYVGLDAGQVEFRQVLGRPDLSGMPVNMAARLHKLVPDLSGQIFLGQNTVECLSPDLRDRARPYGVRTIKGVGEMEIHSLDWDEAVTVMPTRFALPPAPQLRSTILGLAHLNRSFRLTDHSPHFDIGRHRGNDLCIDDPHQRLSSRHARLFSVNGIWTLKDISRNGTWVQFGGHSGAMSLLGDEIKLVQNGRLCLGRSFAEDRDGRFTVAFALVES